MRITRERDRHEFDMDRMKRSHFIFIAVVCHIMRRLEIKRVWSGLYYMLAVWVIPLGTSTSEIRPGSPQG